MTVTEKRAFEESLKSTHRAAVTGRLIIWVRQQMYPPFP
jgi:hypothetical protein